PRLHVPTPQGGGQVRPRVSELLAGRQPRRPQGHAADDPGMAGPTEERQEPDRSLGHARTDTEGMACLDGAPSSRVWLRLCERFGCGHVFGLLARETNVPLALMLVRMALRPISKTRSLWRLPFSSGFRADPLVPMSGRRPVVKGLVEALRTLRVRSCLRPVGAGNECPAGPDVGPHGSSPNQQNALV